MATEHVSAGNIGFPATATEYVPPLGIAVGKENGPSELMLIESPLLFVRTTGDPSVPLTVPPTK
jgi:hypothetical protein